jgi:Poxvirus A32 protein
MWPIQSTSPRRSRPHHEYPPGIIRDRPALCIVIGRKGSGKSQLACRLLKTHWRDQYDRIVFVSPTFVSQFKSLWSSIDPAGVTVHKELTNELLNALLRDAQNNTNGQKILYIFDDVGETLRHMDQSVINTLVSNSRHFGLSLLFLNQKLSQLPTVVRANLDCIISFAACSFLERECLWREVSSVNRKEFELMFRCSTEAPYSFMCSTVHPGAKMVHYGSDMTTVLG